MWSRWKQRVSVMALLLAGLYALGFVFLTFYEHSYSVTHPSGLLSMEYESRRFDTSDGVGSNVRPEIVGSRGPISLQEFWAGHETGNPLIDKYGAPGHELAAGGLGRGVAVSSADQKEVKWNLQEFHVNVLYSDIIPLNRIVPDSRIDGCTDLTYPHALPRASIIIPFYNEWPSLLLRTVYSIINRSPRHLIREILLIDDASTMESLQGPLEDDIKKNFPEHLIVLLRTSERKGLVAARMRGAKEAKGDVLIFFDSHMEVNVDWLQPLLLEVSKDSNTVAMAFLDYIDAESLSYNYKNYPNRYGWSWDMRFFETQFRPDQIGKNETDPRPGATMVGSAFAIDRAFFFTLGGYDEDMTVWGGENLEMSWRVWLCGGRLLHVPCSHIGHLARTQPYTFPGGRENITHYNIERAIRVWMGDYSRYVYNIHPDMKDIDVGDLSKRLAIKEKLQCKDFQWYLQNVWPELNPYDEDVQLWGRVKNEGVQQCLDNARYLFSLRGPLYILPCDHSLHLQGFSLTLSGQLRTTLQCVVPFDTNSPTGGSVELKSCLLVGSVTWEYTKASQLMHVESGRCLDIGTLTELTTAPCDPNQLTQIWTFMQDFPL